MKVQNPSVCSHSARKENIDFGVSGGHHGVVKLAENFRLRELVKKIENHRHQEALQSDLQQNNSFNQFSAESKVMIREMGNVEWFEVWESRPKVHCSECLLYGKQGMVYCTCGHFFRESESSRSFHQWRLNGFTIKNLRHQERATSWCSARQN